MSRSSKRTPPPSRAGKASYVHKNGDVKVKLSEPGVTSVDANTFAMTWSTLSMLYADAAERRAAHRPPTGTGRGGRKS